MIRVYNWRWMLVGVITFIIGTIAFYFGGMMTFFVPGDPGEPFFQKDRVLRGILPLLGAISILSLAGWFFLRSVRGNGTASGPGLPTMIAYCILGAIGAFWLFFMAIALISYR